MHKIPLLVLLLIFNFSVYSQDYINEVIAKHLSFFYSQDSLLMSNGRVINISLDSLIILNENNQIVKKYWEIDSNGRIIHLYLEITKNTLFVIQELDTNRRTYLLYKKKGSKKVVLYSWIDDGFEKTKTILSKPNPKSIKYFDGGSPF